jgi:hypothetical protein
MAALFLAGCQATPEKEIVGQKDMEKLIEKAVAQSDTPKDASLAEYLNAPETYTVSFDGYNGDLTVNANAIVTIPDSNGISAMRVSRHYFTQEEADKMMEVFLQGETLYDCDHPLTKTEIQDKLVQLYAMRDLPEAASAAGVNPNDAQYNEKLQKDIDNYESLLAVAPETMELTPAETTFHPSDAATNPNAQVIEGISTVNAKTYYLLINNGFYNENNVEAVFTTAGQSLEGSYSSTTPYYTILNGEEMSGVQPPETFTLIESEAQSVAEDLLAELGMTYMICVDTKYAATEKFTPGTEPEHEKWAYYLQFQRTVNGIPVTLTDHTGVITENDVSVPWPYERLTIIVDETGVVSFNYTSPCSIEDTVTENASLLGFSEITSVFEKMLPITYGYLDEEDYSLQVNITEVRLGLMRISEQNNRDTGLLVPVWDFYGEVTTVPDEGEPNNMSGGPGSLLTINAIDGAIIDRNLGY